MNDKANPAAILHPLDPATGALGPARVLHQCELGDGRPDGDDLKAALVASAGKNLTDAQRTRQPHAGGVFSFRIEIPGLIAPGFAGSWLAAALHFAVVSG